MTEELTRFVQQLLDSIGSFPPCVLRLAEGAVLEGDRSTGAQPPVGRWR